MTTRSQRIVQLLREGILEGIYAGGMHMNEIELAEKLEVSRTPIRAALSVLAGEGLLHYTPNSGFVVHKFTSLDIERIFELRATLTGLAARLATQHGLGAEFERLEAETAAAKALVDSGEWTDTVRDAWQDYNEDFHAAIVTAARNPYLEAALQRTRDIPIIKEIRFRWIDHDSLRRNHDDHLDQLEAIARCEQVRSEAIAAEHVRQNGRRIVQQWRAVEARQSQDTGVPAAGELSMSSA